MLLLTSGLGAIDRRPSAGLARRCFMQYGRAPDLEPLSTSSLELESRLSRTCWPGDREFDSRLLQRRVWCEPDFRGRIPSMTVGDFANADPAPAPFYAREVKVNMAEAGLPAEAERRFPVRIRIGIPRD